MEELDLIAKDQFGVLKFLTFTIFLFACILHTNFHIKIHSALLEELAGEFIARHPERCINGAYLRRLPLRACRIVKQHHVGLSIT